MTYPEHGMIRDEIIRRELSPVSWRIGAHPGGKFRTSRLSW